MSLLTKVLKLAQELDSKGLAEEADVLDKFAGTLAEGFNNEPLSEEDEGTHRKLLDRDWLDPEAYADMFRALFMRNIQEFGLDMNGAAAAAVREMNELAAEIEGSPDPTDDERAQADELFQNILTREE